MSYPTYGDVRDVLVSLPHHFDGNGYMVSDLFPPRYEIARIVAPKFVFEFGALVGYCLATLVTGARAAGEEPMVGWCDNETYDPESNRKCRENLDAIGVKQIGYVTNRIDSHRFRGDLVSVDGDHSFEGCMADLIQAWAMNPRCILIDDYTAHPPVHDAAVDFAHCMNLELFGVETVNGLGVLDIAGHDLSYKLAKLGYTVTE